MLLCREARKYVKVLLSGEGADEIFGGYIRYRKIRENLTDEVLLFSNSPIPEKDASDVLLTMLPVMSERNKLVESLGGFSSIRRLSIYDMETFLPSLLLRQDKMGMAFNIENRFPFLDDQLVQSALALPDKETCDKRFLKAIASKYLPRELVYRRKCGFGLPIRNWLMNESGFGKYLQFLTKPRVQRRYFNYENICCYVEEHLAQKRDNSEVLWMLICLEVWLQIFIDNKNPSEIWN